MAGGVCKNSRLPQVAKKRGSWHVAPVDRAVKRRHSSRGRGLRPYYELLEQRGRRDKVGSQAFKVSKGH